MPTSPRALGGMGGRKSTHSGTSEVLLARFQAKLESNPELWMVQKKKNEEVTDLHMADLALQFKVAEKVVVETESAGARKATVRFVGKAPEIAPGFWIGVEFEKPDGKNDGAVNGARYFQCEADHGSFLRPNRIKHEADIPAQRRAHTAREKKALKAHSTRKHEQVEHDTADALDALDTREADSIGVDHPAPPPKGNKTKDKPKLKLKAVESGQKDKGGSHRSDVSTPKVGASQTPKEATSPKNSPKGSPKASPKGSGSPKSSPKGAPPKRAGAGKEAGSGSKGKSSRKKA